jgi:hypothetical protein
MRTECTKLTRVLTKVMAVLMAACLTAASTACVAQTQPPPPTAVPAPPPTTAAPAYATPAPSASSLAAWIELGSDGTRHVYYLSNDGKVVHAGQFPPRKPRVELALCPPGCFPTPVGCMCP